MNEKKTRERNELLDRVVGMGTDVAVPWLRSAFHTHEEQIDSLKEKRGELARLFLEAVSRPLTVREAQLCRVCRLCRRDVGDTDGVFVFDHGEEYACEACLNPAGNGGESC